MTLPTDFAVRHETKRQALIDARTAIVILEAEVRTYDEIAALLQKPQDKQPTPVVAPEIRPHKTRVLRRKKTRSACLRGSPRAIIMAIAAAHPRTCDMAFLTEALDRAGQAILPDTLRSALASHVKRGYLERVAPGVFKATPAGAAAAGTKLRE